jgi:hypothetical protein
MIELDDDSDDLDEDKNSENKSDDVENIILSKHKVEGKTLLKYDSIFKGKKRKRSYRR